MIRFVLDTRKARQGLIRELYDYIVSHPGDEEVRFELVTSQGTREMRVKPRMGLDDDVWDHIRSLDDGLVAIPVGNEQAEGRYVAAKIKEANG